MTPAEPISSSAFWRLDSGWPVAPLGIPVIDLGRWGPLLRYHATSPLIDAFESEVNAGGGNARFVLYGSGDFHHLAGLRLRQLSQPAVVVSFDNHPDWDIRPPRWACGGWLSRALRNPKVKRASVWGCGNFELRWPARMFADHAALRDGRLEINAWAERQPASVQRRWNCMNQENWRDRFAKFAQSIAGESVYITVDLDCLALGQSVTNWENGLFSADDVAWALNQLHEHSNVVGGDLCGAYSPPVYSRPMQRLAGKWDHPRLPPIDVDEAQRINQIALKNIWPALVNSATR